MNEFDDIEMLDFIFDAILWVKEYGKEHFFMELTHALVIILVNVIVWGSQYV